MKYGISLSSYETTFGPIVLKQGSLEEKIKIASELHYDGIDLFSHSMNADEVLSTSKLLSKHNIEIAMFIPFFLAELKLSFADTHDTERETFIEAYKEQINIAEALNSKVMPIGFIRGTLCDEDTFKAYKRRLAQSLQIISGYARKHNVTLCLEPINSNEINTFYHCKEAYDYINDFNLDNMMLLLDTYHINYEDITQADAIEYCKDRIGHYHLSDSHRLPPGEGSVDFKSVFKRLNSIGYSGYASIESCPSGTEFATAKTSMDYIKNLQGGL